MPGFRLWPLALLCSLLLSAEAAAANGRMPVYPGLEVDVAFWERIFAKYEPHHCVFHDKNDLGTIYGVAKLPEGSPAAQARFSRRYLEILKNALAHLGDGGEPRNRLERLIMTSTPKERRQPSFFREAVQNVRCQRGVDIKESIARSRQHLPMVKRVLSQHKIPEELAHLPHLESGYQTHAHSRAGAKGIWQIMPATARSLGLRVTKTHDARVHPLQSTVAAAKYLRQLYQRTGSWPLAVTAYNYGPNGTARAIKQWGADYMKIRENHKTRIFGFAAKNYYPSFLAARNVAEAMIHGKELALNVPIAGESVRVAK